MSERERIRWSESGAAAGGRGSGGERGTVVIEVGIALSGYFAAHAPFRCSNGMVPCHGGQYNL